jgi:phenylpropionate dioxygenase-like ring-hydroxylating dioxygenase large terminal subunit
MLKNFWYPIEFAKDISTKPKRAKVLGQDLVVYRTESGEAQVMSDLCVHRGGALSGGWVEKGCIVCPYHGWQYEKNGQCSKIPANFDNVPIPKRARVDSYPTIEKYDFVWAFLGDLPEEERPPLPDLPHHGNPEFKQMTGEYHWQVNYERSLENSADIAHAPFVHSESFGNKDKPQVPDYEIIYGDYSAEATVTLEPPNPKGIWGLFAKKDRPGVKTRAGFYMPNVTLLEVTLPIGLMVLLNFHIPVDEFNTVVKWINLRTFFKGNWADGDARKRVDKIFGQDKAVLEEVRPEILPFDIAAELHVKSDAIQIAYRKMRNKYIEKGWGIDMHKIRSELTGRMFTVIPSPSRKEVPELANAWVMKQVPTTQEADPDVVN